MRYKLMAGITFLLLVTFAEITPAQTAKDFTKMRDKWIYSVSKKNKKVPQLYLKQALMIKPDERIAGQDAIRLHVVEHPLEFQRYSSSESLQLFKHSDRKVLDIGYLNSEDDQNRVVDRTFYVIAWRKIDDTWLRELDIFLPSEDVEFTDDTAAEARFSWVTYANAHDPATMVSSLFLHDAVYLNNSQASYGHSEIAQRLDFIRQPAFSINLKNVKFIRIDDSTAIDIGNWQTSDFVGYYLIMWKMDEASEWKISVYFNF